MLREALTDSSSLSQRFVKYNVKNNCTRLCKKNWSTTQKQDWNVGINSPINHLSTAHKTI